MSYHIVNIDSPDCFLSCRDGQLTCRTAAGEKKLPLEDVASILITSWSACVHSSLLVQAARHGVALILCEAFKPVSLMLPAMRSTDTLLSRAQLRLSKRLRDALWQKTVDAKCANQCQVAGRMAPGHPGLAALEAAAAGSHPAREAATARAFWRVMAGALGQQSFTRTRGGGGLNDLLNYGYAVLLSCVLQKLYALGMDPTWGIAHAPRERAAPLAYDLMEPFRPCVDWRVYQWVREHPGELAVTAEYRRWITGLTTQRVPYAPRAMQAQLVIEAVLRSFRRALMEASAPAYRPWTLKGTKWAG